MEKRIAVMGIIVDNISETGRINALLHDFREYVVGRMGIPYAPKDIAIISVVIDAPQDIISALSGKLGMIDGVSVKTVYSKK